MTLTRHGCSKDRLDESSRFLAYCALFPFYSHKPGASSYPEPIMSTSIKLNSLPIGEQLKEPEMTRWKKSLKFTEKNFQCLVIEVCPKLEIRILKTSI